MDLTQIIDRFLNEQLELRDMSLRQATRLRFRLIGDASLAFAPIEYVRFLKASGMATPTLADLNSQTVGRYWEFASQHHGTVHTSKAMKALRAFWEWCVANEYIKDRPTPPELSP